MIKFLFTRKVVTSHINSGEVYFNYPDGKTVVYNIAHRPRALRVASRHPWFRLARALRSLQG